MPRFFPAVLLCVLAAPLAAQPVHPVVSLRMGVTPTQQSHPDKRQRTVYPEIEVGTSAVQVGRTSWSVTGAAYLGAWNDGVTEPTTRPDCRRNCATFARRSVTVGMLTTLTTSSLPTVLPTVLRVGVSHHFVWAEVLRGPGVLPEGAVEEQHYSTLDFGIRMFMPLSERLRTVADAHIALLSSQRDSVPLADRLRWTLGVSYALR